MRALGRARAASLVGSADPDWGAATGEITDGRSARKEYQTPSRSAATAHHNSSAMPFCLDSIALTALHADTARAV